MTGMSGGAERNFYDPHGDVSASANLLFDAYVRFRQVLRDKGIPRIGGPFAKYPPKGDLGWDLPPSKGEQFYGFRKVPDGNKIWADPVPIGNVAPSYLIELGNLQNSLHRLEPEAVAVLGVATTLQLIYTMPYLMSKKKTSAPTPLTALPKGGRVLVQIFYPRGRGPQYKSLEQRTYDILMRPKPGWSPNLEPHDEETARYYEPVGDREDKYTTPENGSGGGVRMDPERPDCLPSIAQTEAEALLAVACALPEVPLEHWTKSFRLD